MTKYKDVEKKIDEALNLSQKSGKEYGFNICMGGGGEITTTNIEERDGKTISSESKCQDKNLGSFHANAIKDAIPSQK